jgi:hypothetical protein
VRPSPPHWTKRGLSFEGVDCLPCKLAERSTSTAAPRGGNARAAANVAAPQSHVKAWALRTSALEAGRLEALLWHAPDRLKAGLVPGFVSGFNADSESHLNARPAWARALVWFLTSHPLHVHEVNNQTRVRMTGNELERTERRRTRRSGRQDSRSGERPERRHRARRDARRPSGPANGIAGLRSQAGRHAELRR